MAFFASGRLHNQIKVVLQTLSGRVGPHQRGPELRVIRGYLNGELFLLVRIELRRLILEHEYGVWFKRSDSGWNVDPAESLGDTGYRSHLGRRVLALDRNGSVYEESLYQRSARARDSTCRGQVFS